MGTAKPAFFAATMSSSAMEEAIGDLLLPQNRYSVESLGALSDLVKMQVEDASLYSLDVNLAVLKLYQFYPAPDFQLCTFLIPEPLLTPKILKLFRLPTMLERAAFAQVWADYEEKYEPVVGSVAGFDDAVRNYAADILTSAYRAIAMDELSQALNLSGSDLTAFIDAHEGWEVTDEDGPTVRFPVNDYNEAKAKKITESLTFTQVAALNLA